MPHGTSIDADVIFSRAALVVAQQLDPPLNSSNRSTRPAVEHDRKIGARDNAVVVEVGNRRA